MIDDQLIVEVRITNANSIILHIYILSLYCCRIIFFVFNFFSIHIYPKLRCSQLYHDRIAVMPEIFIPSSRHSFVSPISMVLFQPRKIQKPPYIRTRSASNVFIEPESVQFTRQNRSTSKGSQRKKMKIRHNIRHGFQFLFLSFILLFFTFSNFFYQCINCFSSHFSYPLPLLFYS